MSNLGIRVAGVMLTILMMSFLLHGANLQARVNGQVPVFIVSQTAGYIGYMAAGAGLIFFNRLWETSAIYGYVPEHAGGTEIHTLAWKNCLHPFRIKVTRVKRMSMTPVYAGMTLLFPLDSDLYTVGSKKYPENYYLPAGSHLVLNIGHELTWNVPGSNGSFSLYGEFAFVGTNLIAYMFEDGGYLRLRDVATVALGGKYIF